MITSPKDSTVFVYIMNWHAYIHHSIDFLFYFLFIYLSTETKHCMLKLFSFLQ